MARARRRDRARERTAYHEAGHAVMAHVCGIPVKRVSIVEDDEALGHMLGQWERWIAEIDYNVTPMREIRLHKHIMVALAGAAATAIHANYATWRGAGQDLINAAGLADYITGGPEETDALVRWLWIRARTKLEGPPTWAKVEAVAQALLAQEQLSGRAFRAVLDSQWQAQREAVLRRIATGMTPQEGVAPIALPGAPARP